MSKIMIVEDDPEIGSLLKNIVTSATFDALLLTSGDECFMNWHLTIMMLFFWI